jgi:hypothetical protein
VAAADIVTLATPTEVRRRLAKPRATLDRQLQALHGLGIVELDEENYLGEKGKWQTYWRYTLAEGIEPTELDPDTVTDLYRIGARCSLGNVCSICSLVEPSDRRVVGTSNRKPLSGRKNEVRCTHMLLATTRRKTFQLLGKHAGPAVTKHLVDLGGRSPP